MADFFIRDAARVYGPYSPGRIRQLAAAGRITPAWWIGKTREGPWVLAAKVDGLFPTAVADESLSPSPAAATPVATPWPAAANATQPVTVPHVGLDASTAWVCRLAMVSAVVAGMICTKTLLLWLMIGPGSPWVAHPAARVAMGVLDLVSMLTGMLFGVTFLTWVYRANRLLRERDGAAMRFTPGWAVAWFFVPVANLYKPFQVMNELWHESHGRVPSDLAIVRRWWGLVIATVALTVLLGACAVICAVRPSAPALNSLYMVVMVISLVDMVDKVVRIALVSRIRNAFRGASDPRRSAARHDGMAAGVDGRFWAFMAVAMLLPCLLLVGARPLRPGAVRQDGRAPTGWYREDLPEAVEQAKRDGKDLLVLFTAEWCGPCRALKRDLAEAEALRRDLLVCVIDCDQQKQLSALHHVRGIPDLRLYRNGEQVRQKTGYGGSIKAVETWLQDR